MTTVCKIYVFNESKKGSDKILELLKFFGINKSINVTLIHFNDIDIITQHIIDEYNLDVILDNVRLYSSLVPDSHYSSGIHAFYCIIFIIDDLVIFKGIDYIEVIKSLESKENDLPPLVSQFISTCINHWKEDFKDKSDLFRTEVITWVTTVNQQMQASFNTNNYFIFKLKYTASYLMLTGMFLMRDIDSTS